MKTSYQHNAKPHQTFIQISTSRNLYKKSICLGWEFKQKYLIPISNPKSIPKIKMFRMGSLGSDNNVPY